MANLANGDTYGIGADLLPAGAQIGDLLQPNFVEELAAARRELTEDEQRVDDALRRGDPIALVEAQVAQKLELGARELERRRRRRARRS